MWLLVVFGAGGGCQLLIIGAGTNDDSELRSAAAQARPLPTTAPLPPLLRRWRYLAAYRLSPRLHSLSLFHSVSLSIYLSPCGMAVPAHAGPAATRNGRARGQDGAAWPGWGVSWAAAVWAQVEGVRLLGQVGGDEVSRLMEGVKVS